MAAVSSVACLAGGNGFFLFFFSFLFAMHIRKLTRSVLDLSAVTTMRALNLLADNGDVTTTFRTGTL
jgi:hypothetical protein